MGATAAAGLAAITWSVTRPDSSTTPRTGGAGPALAMNTDLGGLSSSSTFDNLLALLFAMAMFAFVVATLANVPRWLGALNISRRQVLFGYLRLGWIASLPGIAYGLAGVMNDIGDHFIGRQAFYAPDYRAPFPLDYTGPATDVSDRQTMVISAATVLVTALLFAVVHRVMTWIAEPRDQRWNSVPARCEVAAGVIVFGVASLIAVPIAVSRVLGYFTGQLAVLVFDYDALRWEAPDRNGPEAVTPFGVPLFFAAIILALWALYLIRLARLLKRRR